jgi:hypothetical protein
VVDWLVGRIMFAPFVAGFVEGDGVDVTVFRGMEGLLMVVVVVVVVAAAVVVDAEDDEFEFMNDHFGGAK